MRRIMCVILSLACIFAFAACGGEQKPVANNTIVEYPPEPEPENILPESPREAFPVAEEEKIQLTASWVGYPEMDFQTFLQKGFECLGSSAEGMSIESCEVVVKDGWDCEDNLPESTVAEGNKAVSYIAYLTQKVGEEAIDIGFIFYMELSPDGILVAKGAEDFAAGMTYGSVYDETETEGMLTEMKEFLLQKTEKE